MRRNLDIATLRSFAAVIDAGGVTRAASRLNLTQSAVSMQIKRLEQSLDTVLLDRNGRGVSLSAEGEQLLTYARRLVAVNDEAVDRMVAPRFEGEVSFGVPCDMIYPHAPGILSRFDNDFPRVRVRFVSSYSADLIEQFHAGKLDVIVTTERTPAEDAEVLTSVPLLWYGAKGGRAWMRDPFPYATARNCAFRPVVVSALEEAEIPWRSGVETETEDGAVAATTADLAVMSLLEGAFDERLEPVQHNGKLPPLPDFSVNLYVAKNTSNENLGREFGHYVRDAYAA